MAWLSSFAEKFLLGLLSAALGLAIWAGGWQALAAQDPMAPLSQVKERVRLQWRYGLDDQPLVAGFFDSVAFYGDGGVPAADRSAALDFVEAGLPGQRVRFFAADGAFAPDYLGLATEMQREGLRPRIALVEVNLESFYTWSPGPVYSAADRELAWEDLLRVHSQEPLSALALAAFYAADRGLFARRLAPVWAGASHFLQSRWQRGTWPIDGGAPLVTKPACGGIEESLGPSRAAPGRLADDLIQLSRRVAAMGGQTAFVIVPMDLRAVEACDPALASRVDELCAALSADLQTRGVQAVIADLHRGLKDGFNPGSLTQQGRRNRQWLGVTMAHMVRDMEQSTP